MKSNPVLSYYALTFLVSWGGILTIVGPGGIPGTAEDFQRRLPLVLLALLGGPSVSGLVMTWIVAGRSGLRELGSRLRRFRVSVRWYAVAVLAAPLAMLLVPIVISLFQPGFLPSLFVSTDTSTLIAIGIVSGLMGGFLEELGWTGFVIPRMRQRYSLLSTGLIVGFLWGLWHVLMNFWTSGDASGELSLAQFLHSFLFSLGILPAYRVLMVWVYDRTRSLSLAMLMHLALIVGNVTLAPPGIATMTGPLWSLVVAATLWTVVAFLAARYRWRASDETDGYDRTRQPRWQRIILLCVLGYEAAGALLGGVLLVLAPDGRLMDMPVTLLNGIFRDYLFPGIILIGLGVLATVAFVTVLRRARNDWLLAGFALGSLVVWFIVEIAVIQELHWLHAMWGLPVLTGCLLTLPLVPSRYAPPL
jgi:membrane protease YdiL (CAAX protease family)